MNLRIQLSRQTVKALQHRLYQAYDRADLRLVRRISALLEHLDQQMSGESLSRRWDFGVSTFYAWLNELLVEGLDSLIYHQAGGRPAKLTKGQSEVLSRVRRG